VRSRPRFTQQVGALDRAERRVQAEDGDIGDDDL
jgi:hypothetical protein